MKKNESDKKLLEHLTKNELLSVERTQLANKRTLLAFLRTAFSLFIASLAIIEFFENKVFIYLSFILIPLSFVFFILGTVRFLQSQKNIDKIIDDREESE